MSLLGHGTIDGAGISGGSATSASINTTGATLLVVGVCGQSLVSVTDNKSNTWLPLTASGAGPRQTVKLYYAKNPTVGAGHTFTVAASFFTASIASFDGILTTAEPFDVQNGAVTPTGDTGISAGSVTPSQAGELIVTAFGLDDPGSNTIGITGYTISDTLDTVSGSRFGVSLAYQVQGAATATNPAWTRSNANTQSGDCAVLATFKGSVVSAGAALPIPYAQNIALNPQLRARRTMAAYSADIASAGAPVTVATDVGLLTLTGFAPTIGVTNNQTVLPGAGVLTVTGFAPTVSVSNNQRVLPGVGALTLTGFAPTVAVSTNQNVAPGVGALALTGFAPTVTVSNNQTVASGVGQLTLTGFAPTVLVGTRVAPGVGALTLTGFAPIVTATANQTAATGVGQLTLAGYAPTVTVSIDVVPSTVLVGTVTPVTLTTGVLISPALLNEARAVNTALLVRTRSLAVPVTIPNAVLRVRPLTLPILTTVVDPD